MTTTRSRHTRRDEPAQQEDREHQQDEDREHRQDEDRERRHGHEGRERRHGREGRERQHEHEAAGDGHHPRSAAEKAARHNSSHLHLPIIGEIELPARDELAYIGGLTVLGVMGAVDWPVVGLLALGHALISNRRNKVVREFGEALEEA